jgi:peptidoglycan/LPS O-acetylase OafA/YrhL
MTSSGWELRKLTISASANLDVIRTVAAWAVMWGHLRTLFFVDFRHLARANWLVGAIYFFTGFGHQAVMVFFVLSGFLISRTVFRAHISGTWSWLEYIINRSTRLYVVLIPGLLLGLLWDAVGSSLFAFTGLYTHALTDLGPSVAVNNLTAANFFGNFFFLQTIACPTFGSNAPLWSLANEFWYYALFPMALSTGIACARRTMQVAIPLGLAAICLAVFLGPDKLTGFLIWMSGCALVLAYGRFPLQARNRLFPYLITFSLVLCGSLASARTSFTGTLGSDLAVGIAFTLFLFGVLQLELGAGSPRFIHAASRLAGFSYSLYVLHFPLLLFLRAWIAPLQRWRPDGVHLLYGGLIGVVVLVFSWTVSLFTEKKTDVARQWVRKQFLFALSRP